MSNVRQQRVLITGTSSGIGRALAQELTARGAHVIATARRRDAIMDLGAAETYELDVTDENSVATVRRVVGDVDVLVNNAGVLAVGPVEAITDATLARVFDVNVFGAARIVRAFVPSMRRRGRGTVVNVSTALGCVAMPLFGAYSASKYALEAMSESLHFELGHFGVRVLLVEPAGVATPALSAPTRDLDEDHAYDALLTQLQGAFAPESLMSSATAAYAIANAIEAGGPTLRWPIGEAAQHLLAARKTCDDGEMSAVVRMAFHLEW